VLSEQDEAAITAYHLSEFIRRCTFILQDHDRIMQLILDLENVVSKNPTALALVHAAKGYVSMCAEWQEKEEQP
jgi:hypothetical protein